MNFPLALVENDNDPRVSVKTLLACSLPNRYGFEVTWAVEFPQPHLK